MTSAHPYRHLALAHPISAALLGFGVFLALFLLAPIRVAQDISLWGPLYAAAMYGMFFLGVVSYQLAVELAPAGLARVPAAQHVGTDTYTSLQRWFWILLIVAWVAEAAWLIDRFMLRGVSLDADALERREALEGSSSTPLSIIAAVFCPASFLIWHVALSLRNSASLPRWKAILAFVTYWLPAMNILLLGSRSTVLIALTFMILISAYHAQRRINWLGLSLLVAVLVLAIVFFVQTILYRLSLIGLSGLYSIENSVYAFTLQPQPFLVDALSIAQSGFWESALFASSNIAQYYCHGLFELFYQIDNFSGYQHSLGTNTFFVPYKFLTILVPGLPDALEMMASARPHYGAFGSFFGPLHSDFGWNAVIFMYLFGILCGFLHGLAWRNQAWVPLYGLVVSTIFLFPVINMLVAGAGFYLFFGFVVFAVAHRSKAVVSVLSPSRP